MQALLRRPVLPILYIIGAANVNTFFTGYRPFGGINFIDLDNLSFFLLFYGTMGAVGRAT